MALDLLVTEVLAVDTSDRVLLLGACDTRDLPNTDDGAADCALMLGRVQLPDFVEVDDFGSEICDGVFSLDCRGLAYPAPLSTRGETVPLLELRELREAYAGSVCAATTSCMFTWSSILASAMYWPQPRRVHLIHRSLASERVSKSATDRPLRWR